MRIYKRILLATAAIVSLGGASTKAADQIGTAAAVKNRATGTLGAKTRALKSGIGVFKNERVDTARDATAQLIFSDETALTIGPNSSVTLDEFVYDPQKNTGKAVINATKGAFRFISGSADPRSYRIKTPVGTMGVRGTIVDFFFLANGAFVAILVEGAFQFTTEGNPPRTISVTKPGDSLIIHPDGTSEGPKSWDGTIAGRTVNISFPLFGRRAEGDQNPQWRPPYSIRDINKAVNGETPVPHPPGSIIYCWVARAVYGEDDPNWRLFRSWLLEDAPAWLRTFYIHKGERIGRWIGPHRCMKTLVRRWMDARIAGHLDRKQRPFQDS